MESLIFGSYCSADPVSHGRLVLAKKIIKNGYQLHWFCRICGNTSNESVSHKEYSDWTIQKMPIIPNDENGVKPETQGELF